MSGIMQMVLSSGGSAGGATYLDSLATTPRAAFGLRKLISTAALCLRVRRSSDSAEQDIGFSGNTIDTAALLAFLSTNSGFVRTWYDQTGNGEHLEQTTAANQPYVVDTGTFLGTLSFGIISSNHALKITSLTLGTPYWDIYSRRKVNAAATRVLIELSADASGANSQAAFIYSATTNQLIMYSQNGSGAQRSRSYACAATTMQATELFDRSIVGATEEVAYQNGSAMSMTNSGTTEQTGNFTSYDCFVGARNSASLWASMEMDTLVLYNADTASIRSSIEAIVA